VESIPLFVDVLDRLRAILVGAPDRVMPTMLVIIQTALLGEILLLCYGFMTGSGALEGMVRFTVKTGLVWSAMQVWLPMHDALIESWSWLGLQLAGASIQVRDILDPGTYIALGDKTAEPLFQHMQATLGWRTVTLGLVYFGLWLTVMGAYILQGIQVFIWQVETLVGAGLALVLLPALLFRPLSFIGRGALGFAVNCTFRFCVGGFLAGLTQLAMKEFVKIPLEAGLRDELPPIILAWTCAILFWRANRIASTMMTGIPNMSGQQLLHDVISTVMTTTGATRIVGGAALASVGTAGRAGASLLEAGRGASGGAAATAAFQGTISGGGTSSAFQGTISPARGAATGSLHDRFARLQSVGLRHVAGGARQVMGHPPRPQSDTPHGGAHP
jgi:hypothetical protein